LNTFLDLPIVYFNETATILKQIKKLTEKNTLEYLFIKNTVNGKASYFPLLKFIWQLVLMLYFFSIKDLKSMFSHIELIDSNIDLTQFSQTKSYLTNDNITMSDCHSNNSDSDSNQSCSTYSPYLSDFYTTTTSMFTATTADLTMTTMQPRNHYTLSSCNSTTFFY
jgi:hypothetical protein